MQPAFLRFLFLAKCLSGDDCVHLSSLSDHPLTSHFTISVRSDRLSKLKLLPCGKLLSALIEKFEDAFAEMKRRGKNLV